MNFDTALRKLDKLNNDLIIEQNLQRQAEKDIEILDSRQFIEKYLYIKTKDAKLKLFKLNDPQSRIYNIIEKQRSLGKPVRLIVLKARQEGVSTLSEGLIFENTTNNSNINSLILAHDADGSDHVFGMSKLFYEMLPDAKKPATNYSNRKEIDYKQPLSSRIQVDTAGSAGV